MCNRKYCPDVAAWEREFSTPRRWNPLTGVWRPDYNVSPTTIVPVLRAFDGQRDAVLARWGLIPGFAKGQPLTKRGTKTKLMTNNARSETVKTAPTFRTAWSRAQRCISPVGGWFEWTSEHKKKLPWLLHLADCEVFGLAGLWDTSVKDDGAEVLSYTTLMVPSGGFAAQFHHRMPVILAERDFDAWLDGSEDVAEALMVPFTGNTLTAYRVSTYVNSVRNKGPECIKPLKNTA